MTDNKEKYEKILNKIELYFFNPSLCYNTNQQFIKNYIRPENNINKVALIWGTGEGKCHKKGTSILMHSGKTKLVENIVVGDLLMGDDSNPRKVLSLARGRDEMYEIWPTKGESYTVNKEHILCLKQTGYPKIQDEISTSRFRIYWVEDNKFKSKSFSYKNKNKTQIKKESGIFYTKILKHEQIIEIPVKEYIKLSKTKQKQLKQYNVPIDFPEKYIDIDPYMIGYWLGDGSSGDSEITSQDSTILKYFRDNLGKYNLNLNFRGFTGNPGSNKFLNNKYIPYEYKCNSRKNRLKLLAGIIDSDGHYSHKGYEITLKSEQLMDDLIYLCRSLGFACCKKQCKKSGDYFRITINGNGIEEIPCLIPRKKASPRKQIKDVLVSGIKIISKGKDDYYGFTIDGNHRYLLGNFVVTHNSLASVAISEIYWKENNQEIFVLVKNETIKNNFKKEFLKCFPDSESVLKKTFEFQHFISFSNRVLGSVDPGTGKRVQHKNPIKNLSKKIIIIDEFHNILGTETYDALQKVINNSKDYRLVLLSATPFTDNIYNIYQISNLLNNQEEQIQKKDAKKLFTEIQDDTFKVKLYKLNNKGIDIFKNLLLGKISYLFSNDKTKDFPKLSINIVKSKLTDRSLYDKSLINDKDNFYKETLKICSIHSTKMEDMYNNILKTSGTVFCWSSLVNKAGTKYIYNYLNSRRIKCVMITQNTSHQQREKIISKFNSVENKNGDIIKVLIGSNVLSEGVSLLRVRQVHIFEPAWNWTKIEQVIGRARRYKSHQDLNEKERYLDAFIYTTENTIEYDKLELSLEKNKYIKETIDFIRKLSIDCSIRGYKDCIINKPDIPNDDSTLYKSNLLDTDLLNKIKKYKFFNASFEDLLQEFKTNDVDDGYFKLRLAIVLNKLINDNILIKIRGLYYNKKEWINIQKSLPEIIFQSIFENYNKKNKTPEIVIRKQSTKNISRKVSIDKSGSSSTQILTKGIYGTFKNRYGEIDNKFRIIIINSNSNNDKRKVITGIDCNSIKIDKLQEIMKNLDISDQIINKTEICEKIKTTLKTRSLIL